MPSVACGEEDPRNAEQVRQISCVEEVHALLGQGSFSKVYRCSITGWKEDVALKVLDGVMSVSAWLKAEVDPMSTRKHPSLVSLLRVIEGPPDCLIFELCRGGTLRRYLQQGSFASYGGCSVEESVLGSPISQAKKGVLTSVGIAEKLRGAWQVASAIEYLHSSDIIHRSVNPANVFLMEPFPEDVAAVNMPTMKLGDLRLARYVRGPLNPQPMTRCVGMPAYSAPEVMTEDDYGLRADVFSFAMLMYELMSGEQPYGSLLKMPMEADHDGVQLVLKILEGHRPSLDGLSGDGMTPDLSSLLVECWDTSPAQRPSSAELASRLRNMVEARAVDCGYPR